MTAFDSFTSSPDRGPAYALRAYDTHDLGNMPGLGFQSDVYTAAPDGSGPHRLTTASRVGSLRIGHPRWDPDGTRLWVTVEDTNGVHLGRVDPTSGALTDLPIEGAHPEPRPLP